MERGAVRTVLNIITPVMIPPQRLQLQREIDILEGHRVNSKDDIQNKIHKENLHI